MQTVMILVTASGLAMDCFAVSLAIATSDRIPDLCGFRRNSVVVLLFIAVCMVITHFGLIR